jgi:hypothetical protein
VLDESQKGCVVGAKSVFHAIDRYSLLGLGDPCSSRDMLMKLRRLSPGPRLAMLSADWLDSARSFTDATRLECTWRGIKLKYLSIHRQALNRSAFAVRHRLHVNGKFSRDSMSLDDNTFYAYKSSSER